MLVASYYKIFGNPAGQRLMLLLNIMTINVMLLE
jgi:hypothetical protein